MTKKIRCVYNDGSSMEFTTDDATNYKNLDRKNLESVVLFDDSTEVTTISIPKTHTFAYRTRTIGKLSDANREKFVILGKVNSSEQILYFIDNSNKIETIDTPEEFAKYGKISLTQEESV